MIKFSCLEDKISMTFVLNMFKDHFSPLYACKIHVKNYDPDYRYITPPCTRQRYDYSRPPYHW